NSTPPTNTIKPQLNPALGCSTNTSTDSLSMPISNSPSASSRIVSSCKIPYNCKSSPIPGIFTTRDSLSLFIAKYTVSSSNVLLNKLIPSSLAYSSKSPSTSAGNSSLAAAIVSNTSSTSGSALEKSTK